MSTVDTTNWSGEGTFTQTLIDHLRALDGVAFLRVEDAPASRSEADYNFISNEIFVGFVVDVQRESIRKFGFLPASKLVERKALTVSALEQALAGAPEIGAPDYSDDAMLQYLRTERVIPPYQTRGYKIVELVRIYEAGTTERRE
jgi:hypothetical protein